MAAKQRRLFYALLAGYLVWLVFLAYVAVA